MSISITIDRPERRDAGRIRKRAAAVKILLIGLVITTITPHKASLARLADMPLTAIGAVCIDFAGFHLGHGWGWLITGLSLLIVEHMIADDE